MFRPIRVDHTKCLQVAIETPSFIHSDGHDLRILLSYITRRPGFVDTPPGIHHQTARSLHTHNHPLTDVADSMTSIHRHSGRKVLRQTATLWPCGSTCMRRVGRDHVCVAFLERRAPTGVPSNLAEHNKYLILIPERITLSPRPTCSSTTTTASLSPSVRSKNVMRPKMSCGQKCHAARHPPPTQATD